MIIDIIRISWIMTKKGCGYGNSIANHMKVLTNKTISNRGVILHQILITLDNVVSNVRFRQA